MKPTTSPQTPMYQSHQGMKRNASANKTNLIAHLSLTCYARCVRKTNALPPSM
jgi:hypothetical protein